MVGVFSRVISKKLPDGSVLSLEAYWDGSVGAEVVIMRSWEDKDKIDYLFSTTNLPPEWHTGNFSDEDVKEKFKGKYLRIYNELFKEERDKIYRQALKEQRKPSGKFKSVRGVGSGWHKQPVRHSRARKYGFAGGVYKTKRRK